MQTVPWLWKSWPRGRYRGQALNLLLGATLAAGPATAPPRLAQTLDSGCAIEPSPAPAENAPLRARSARISPAARKQLSQQLLTAVDDENPAAVRRLLARGADANARDPHCVTPLMLAAEDEQIAIAQALLAAGAEVNARDVIGWTALLTAAEAGNAEIIRLFLAHGAEVSAADNDGWTPLIAASLSGKPDGVRLLLEAGADPSLADKNGTTALMLAAAEGDLDILKQLINHITWRGGISPSGDANRGEILNAADHAGWTALHHAASRGHAEAVRLLLAAGARADAKNKFGWTPLMLAVQNGDLETAAALASVTGGNVDAADAQGTTALYLAAARGDAAITRQLLAAHANPNLARGDGRTPLMAACEHSNLETVELLLAAGADVNAATPAGATAFTLASRRPENGQLLQRLKQAGAK